MLGCFRWYLERYWILSPSCLGCVRKKIEWSKENNLHWYLIFSRGKCPNPIYPLIYTVHVSALKVNTFICRIRTSNTYTTPFLRFDLTIYPSEPVFRDPVYSLEGICWSAAPFCHSPIQVIYLKTPTWNNTGGGHLSSTLPVSVSSESCIDCHHFKHYRKISNAYRSSLDGFTGATI